MKQYKLSKAADFTGQSIFVGIDVHLRSWKIAIDTEAMSFKRFSQDPNPDLLAGYLHRHFPGGRYHAVYEAGYCGFWIYESLRQSGVECIVVNPGDVATKDKERVRKTDRIDASKLARELRSGNLEAIYVPAADTLSDRTLVRMRRSQVKKQTRVKNQIKALLRFHGIELPNQFEGRHWARPFLRWLEQMSGENSSLGPRSRVALAYHVQELEQIRARVLELTKEIKCLARSDRYRERVELLVSLPGISTLSAMIWLSELVDIRRFKNLDKLASYVGLVPSTHRSAETGRDGGLTRRRHGTLRHILIESAWVATRNDARLAADFVRLCARMPKTRAIIRIARKQLARIFFVLREERACTTLK